MSVATITFDPTTLTCTFQVVADGENPQALRLATAVAVSVFSDARALPGDVIPDGSNDPRGYWADNATPVLSKPGRRLGSRLWLLSRSKQLPETLALAQSYIQEALSWLEEDGYVTAIDVECWWPRLAWLGFQAT